MKTLDDHYLQTEIVLGVNEGANLCNLLSPVALISILDWECDREQLE